MPDLTIETDDDDVVHDDAAETAAPRRPDTAKALGSMALEAALSRKDRTALR
ncbi:MAG: hypothetical protein JWR51_1670 [Devosia sp.]|uniref:hypothetical protein n=1 Tax=Devosia sp. TaxID=1871048 RepID=UPI00262C4F31|nr:hypothetical protein [Devosia sp.]MDB5528567.1 hypothetical protein [Devosia sp.]